MFFELGYIAYNWYNRELHTISKISAMIKFLTLLIVPATIVSANVINSDLGKGKEVNKSIAYTENKGQVVDQNNNPRPDVLYGVSDGILNTHIRTNGISYQMSKVISYKEEIDEFTGKKNKKPKEVSIYRIDVNWLGCESKFSLEHDKVISGFDNYYLSNIGKDVLNVKSYEGVTLKNIYNSVDLHYYNDKGQIKYDFIVAPNTNYKLIKLQVKGAEIKLKKDGGVLLITPFGSVEEEAPIVFQNGRQLNARWVVSEENTLSFDVDHYNPNYELLIDPVTRIWGTYYGGAGDEYRTSSCSDDNYNIYIAGYTSTITGTIIATTGAHQSTFGGSFYDAYLAKFNSAGVRQWGTYYGGNSEDYAYSCATDLQGNVFIAGSAESTIGIATAGAHQVTQGSTSDAFLAKFNSNGVRQWGTYYGGTGADRVYSCSTDNQGNIFIGGVTLSTNSVAIATNGAHQTSKSFNNDGFLAKFNSSGVRQWGTYYGGFDVDNVYSVATDASGNVFIAGSSVSSNTVAISTLGTHQSTYGGSQDAYLAKFNTSGVRQWGTYYGGSSADVANSCCVDNNGDVYICGNSVSGSASSMTTTGAHQTAYGGGTYDAFLAKFNNNNGARIWGTLYGGSGLDIGSLCCTDASNNIYLCGTTASSGGTSIASAGSHQTALAGNNDAYLAKFTPNGTRQWGTYYGGSDVELGLSCTIDASGHSYLSGLSTGLVGTAIATPGSHQSAIGGTGSADDAFLVKFSDCVVLTPTAAVNSVACFASAINFSAGISVPGSPSYSWKGPGSFTSNIQNPVIPLATAASIGIYTVYVLNNGCIETATTQVNAVNPSPTITVNSGGICFGQSFTITPSGAVTYTIQGGNSVVSPTTSSSYSVIGTSSLGCVSTMAANSNITVYSLPTITVNSGSICIGKSFTITPSGASSYTIQGGNSVVSPIVQSNYTVIGTSSQGCLSQNTATSTVYINSLPVVTASISNSLVCSGYTTALSASGANTYTWSTSASGSNIIVSPVVTGNYTVTGTDLNGCQNSAITSVSVLPLPNVMVAPTNTSICIGNSVTLMSTGANTYTWSNSIIGNSNTVSPVINTSYSVTGTGSNGCNKTVVASIVVNPLPNITATSSEPIALCLGNAATLTASGASNYTWNPGGTGSNITINPTVTTSYTVTGVDGNGCKNTTIVTQSVSACTGVNELALLSSKVGIYPNPANQLLNINIGNLDSSTTKIEVVNCIGKVIPTNVTKRSNNTIELDLSGLAVGMYIVKITVNGEAVANQKFIKN
ncbi:MAG: T9SS type A sorting domain-containing protein [Bacteroidia bacterium]